MRNEYASVGWTQSEPKIQTHRLTVKHTNDIGNMYVHDMYASSAHMRLFEYFVKRVEDKSYLVLK